MLRLLQTLQLFVFVEFEGIYQSTNSMQNRFHVNPAGKNIKSTGFKIAGETATVYITDTPNEDLKTGSLALVKETVADVGGSQQTVTTVVVKDAGTVDYVLGEININTVTVIPTDQPMDIIEIQAFPESNDVIGLKDLYLSFNIDKSEINMVRDVIASETIYLA